MDKPTRLDFDTVESSTVVNQTSCYHIDLSHLTPEQFDQFIEALRAEGLLDEDEQG